MGVYIPNVRLPADGDFELWVAVKKDGSFTYNVSGEWRGGKQKAVPVPPHGRLIDADALKFSPTEFWGFQATDNAKSAETIVNDAPTVIPADEPKEE